MNKRREEILSEIPACKVFRDVGCDHGYVGFECLKRGIAQKVIFSDISAPSLEKAKSLVKTVPEMENQACFLVANGLEGGETKADVCVIAGMGGEEIMKILASTSPEICVLQPMSEVEKLRVFLQDKFEIITDRLFYDRDKYYNLLVVKKGSCKLCDFEIMFGKTNLENPGEDFLIFAKARLERQKSIKNSRKIHSEEDDKIIDFLSEFLDRYKRK